MNKLVYSFATPEDARSCIAPLRMLGYDEKQVSLVARHDIELEEVPEAYLDASTDVGPAFLRGVTYGGASGLFAGLLVAAFPPLGMAFGGAALLTMTGLGASLGAWSAALMGATVPNEVRRAFEHEIEQGRILLVVSADPQSVPALDRLAAIHHGSRLELPTTKAA